MRTSSKRAGFTLLESMVALTIFAVVGYGLAVAVAAGAQTEGAVMAVSSENRCLRDATGELLDELRATNDARINVIRMNDGNDQVRFMQPIEVAGAFTWGVFDRTLGPDADSQNRADWQIQYVVRDAVDAEGARTKQLVRQVLDDQLVVQRERVIAEPMCSANDPSPGFTMNQIGDVWELRLSTKTRIAGKPGMRAVLHVRTRN